MLSGNFQGRANEGKGGEWRLSRSRDGTQGGWSTVRLERRGEEHNVEGELGWTVGDYGSIVLTFLCWWS